MVSISLIAIFGNLTLPVGNYADPMKASKFMNGFYFGVSRVSWLFAVFTITIAIFCGKFGIARALMANGNMRATGKSMIVCCTV